MEIMTQYESRKFIHFNKISNGELYQILYAIAKAEVCPYLDWISTKHHNWRVSYTIFAEHTSLHFKNNYEHLSFSTEVQGQFQINFSEGNKNLLKK